MPTTRSTDQRPDALLELARARGVAVDWVDWKGVPQEVPDATLRAVLGALGSPADTEEQVEESLTRALDDGWNRVLPRSLVLREGRSQRVPVHIPEDASVHAVLRTEKGSELDLELEFSSAGSRDIGGRATVQGLAVVPDHLPLGYHRVEITAGDEAHSMPLIVTPQRLALPDDLDVDGEQWWGMTTQLYAMRSGRSWGIGDLGDLADVGVWGASLGADFVVVNPMHAAEPTAPIEPSPYLPTSRRFSNPMYIRVEDVPEVAYLSAAERQLIEWHGDDARRYLDLDFLERDAVWASKEAALRLVFRAPRTLRRDWSFNTYYERQGEALQDFATWCVLAAEYGQKWRQWPQELQDPRDPAVEKYRQRHEKDVEFYCWLQWVLDEQLNGVQQDLRQTGMRLGVIHDLAVGVHPEGADTWMLPDAVARGVSVGAPPDQYNQLGQDWSQPPWRPDSLAESGYAPFRDMIRQSLRHAGGLRVDHIIGLFRLWWVPDGVSPAEGTYVRMDHDAMIGILLLEAQRAGAVLIGEDLGTVEPWVRAYLSERGVLGTSILWFERDENGPIDPERYRELCLATVTTHDLPPTAGYLAGAHMDLRESLGLIEGDVDEIRARDEADRNEVLEDLAERGLLGGDTSVFAQVKALHTYLTLTPSKLLAVSVSDLAQDRRTINQPGTDEEYPNWRVPLAGPEGRPVLLEDLVGWRSARQLARTLARRVGRNAS